jgi:AraC-like DNA-binding protein
MARKVLNPTVRTSLGSQAIDTAMKTLERIGVEQAKTKRQEQLINYYNQRDQVQAIEDAKKEISDNEKRFQDEYQKPILKLIEEGKYREAELMLGKRDEGQTSIYSMRYNSMLTEDNRTFFRSEEDIQKLIDNGIQSKKDVGADMAVWSDPNATKAEKLNVLARSRKRMKDGLAGYKEIDNYLNIAKDMGFDDDLGFTDDVKAGVTAGTLKSGMSSLYDTVDYFERINMPTNENLQAFYTQSSKNYGLGSLEDEEFRRKIVKDFKNLSSQNAAQTLRQIKSEVILREPGQPNFFELLPYGDFRKEEIFNNVSGLIIEAKPELAKMSRDELKVALEKEEYNKYFRDELTKALGPTWFNTYEKMRKDNSVRYNLLGE